MVNTDTHAQNTALAHSLTPATTLGATPIVDEDPPELGSHKLTPTDQDARPPEETQLP